MDAYIEKQMRDVCEVTELSILTMDLRAYEEDFLKQSEAELLRLLDGSKMEKRAEELDITDIMKLTFDNAHKVINCVSFKRRLKLLADLDKHLVHLYTATEGYNDKGFGKSMSPQVFQGIMGRIKHLEILQNWLYGIE